MYLKEERSDLTMVKFRFYDPDEKPAEQEHPKHAEPVTIHVQKKGFTLDWVHDLGWRENPFTQLTPMPVHEFMVNQDATRQAINLFFIKEQRFGTITGDHGSGKTFMLQWLAEELHPYKDRFEVHYFDAAACTVEQFTEKLTKHHSSFFSSYKGNSPEKLVHFLEGKLKHKLVILVDNANDLGALDHYYKALYAKMQAVIILAGTKPAQLAEDSLNATLVQMSAHDASKMVEKRIGKVGGAGIKPFNHRLLEEVWVAAKCTPKTFLDYCNETAMKVALKQIIIEEESSAPVERAAEKPVKDSKKSVKIDKKAASKNQYDDLIAGIVK
jgi:hypothetical protein